MLRHIVAWKLAAEDVPTKLEQSSAIAAQLQGLVPVIPQILSLTVGSNSTSIPGNWDLVLVADYEDEAALQIYIDHPEHQRVAAFVRSLVSARAAVDFGL